MKIGVFSITLNRLYYNWHCLELLKDRAGMPFEHIIVDNGSKDGSFEWLKETGYNVIGNEENKGITFASMQAYRWLLKKDIDIIIKIDSDCEMLTPDFLSLITKFFSVGADDYVVSPVVGGIARLPDTKDKEVVNGFKVNRTEHIGGIFRAMKMKTFTKVVNGCKGLNDKKLNIYFRENKFKIGYLPEIKVNHFETTKGQEKRYPAYFNKKYIY